ncbi:hypothetical protein C8R43DRAFT_958086 [Mycena crocata]|nr:hypothetical protein C8R43DRAFT_958086 [Mycena crocata]
MHPLSAPPPHILVLLNVSTEGRDGSVVQLALDQYLEVAVPARKSRIARKLNHSFHSSNTTELHLKSNQSTLQSEIQQAQALTARKLGAIRRGTQTLQSISATRSAMSAETQLTLTWCSACRAARESAAQLATGINTTDLTGEAHPAQATYSQRAANAPAVLSAWHAECCSSMKSAMKRQLVCKLVTHVCDSVPLLARCVGGICGGGVSQNLRACSGAFLAVPVVFVCPQKDELGPNMVAERLYEHHKSSRDRAKGRGKVQSRMAKPRQKKL